VVIPWGCVPYSEFLFFRDESVKNKFYKILGNEANNKIKEIEDKILEKSKYASRGSEIILYNIEIKENGIIGGYTKTNRENDKYALVVFEVGNITDSYQHSI
jgi:hypothetical protein